MGIIKNILSRREKRERCGKVYVAVMLRVLLVAIATFTCFTVHRNIAAAGEKGAESRAQMQAQFDQLANTAQQECAKKESCIALYAVLQPTFESLIALRDSAHKTKILSILKQCNGLIRTLLQCMTRSLVYTLSEDFVRENTLDDARQQLLDFITAEKAGLGHIPQSYLILLMQARDTGAETSNFKLEREEREHLAPRMSEDIIRAAKVYNNALEQQGKQKFKIPVPSEHKPFAEAAEIPQAAAEPDIWTISPEAEQQFKTNYPQIDFTMAFDDAKKVLSLARWYVDYLNMYQLRPGSPYEYGENILSSDYARIGAIFLDGYVRTHNLTGAAVDALKRQRDYIDAMMQKLTGQTKPREETKPRERLKRTRVSSEAAARGDAISQFVSQASQLLDRIEENIKAYDRGAVNLGDVWRLISTDDTRYHELLGRLNQALGGGVVNDPQVKPIVKRYNAMLDDIIRIGLTEKSRTGAVSASARLSLAELGALARQMETGQRERGIAGGGGPEAAAKIRGVYEDIGELNAMLEVSEYNETRQAVQESDITPKHLNELYEKVRKRMGEIKRELPNHPDMSGLEHFFSDVAVLYVREQDRLSKLVGEKAASSLAAASSVQPEKGEITEGEIEELKLVLAKIGQGILHYETIRKKQGSEAAITNIIDTTLYPLVSDFRQKIANLKGRKDAANVLDPLRRLFNDYMVSIIPGDISRYLMTSSGQGKKNVFLAMKKSELE